ncbi:hypothetical protein [Insulibacter thermoxylanivorax]|uniref:hypothetical protein n=1 Tax=Insulibacter thermoxylanivorax TaxID=2749268 RepID=UPI00191077A7|nr:hypothetical protein [Insulibacter thermoxylanivorax]
MTCNKQIIEIPAEYAAELQACCTHLHGIIMMVMGCSHACGRLFCIRQGEMMRDRVEFQQDAVW